MTKSYDLQSILERLQRPRGYQGCRIRPHPEQKKAKWLAEISTESQVRTRKSWRPLLTETNTLRLFASPEEAEQALIEVRGPFTDHRPFSAQLESGLPEEQFWRRLIVQEEQRAPGSLETMIEDGATRLVEALRELRTCRSQKRANRLYEIVLGQSSRLSYLAQYVYEEAEQLQWLKVDVHAPSE
jgi:hypothetical protein